MAPFSDGVTLLLLWALLCLVFSFPECRFTKKLILASYFGDPHSKKAVWADQWLCCYVALQDRPDHDLYLDSCSHHAHAFNNVATTSGSAGFYMSAGSATKTGRWSGPMPTCSAITCSVLTAVANDVAYIYSNAQAFNSVATTSCSAGFYLSSGTAVADAAAYTYSNAQASAWSTTATCTVAPSTTTSPTVAVTTSSLDTRSSLSFFSFLSVSSRLLDLLVMTLALPAPLFLECTSLSCECSSLLLCIQYQTSSPFDLQPLTRFRAVIMEDSVMEERLSLTMPGGSMRRTGLLVADISLPRFSPTSAMTLSVPFSRSLDAVGSPATMFSSLQAQPEPCSTAMSSLSSPLGSPEKPYTALQSNFTVRAVGVVPWSEERGSEGVVRVVSKQG